MTLVRAGQCVLFVNVAILLLTAATIAQDGSVEERAVGRRSVSSFQPVADQTGNAALFVGVNEFSEDESLAALSFAVNDAVAIAHLFVIELQLVQPERAILALSGTPRGEESTEQLAALKDAGVSVTDATKSRIFRQLQRVIALPQSDEHLLLLSISSHGFEEEGVPYVMPADGVRSFLADTAINLTSVEQALAKSKAGKRLVLLDACREKPLAGGRGGGAAMSAAFRTALAEASGQALLASCDVGQVSFEDAKLGHGIFTHYLLEGLRGRAKPDAQGLIRLDQVLQYVSREVENWSKRNGPQVQQPWFKGPQIARQIPLAVDPESAKIAREHIAKLRAMALTGELTIDQFQEAERLLGGETTSDVERQRAEIYVKLADGKTDSATATLALSRLIVRRTQTTTSTVAADGSGQYTSIQAAMDEAQSGDTIIVRPGVYRETILFTDGVRLIGTSAEACRIEPEDDAFAILTAFDCSSGSIENLTFDGRGVKAEARYKIGFSSQARDGAIWITQLVPDGVAAAAGVPVDARLISINGREIGDDVWISSWLISRAAPVRDIELVIEHDGARRVFTLRAKRTPLDDADKVPNGLLLYDSVLDVRGCEVREFTGHGVSVRGAAARVKLRESTLRKNGGYGAEAGHGANLLVEDCVVEQNASTGIGAQDKGTVLAARGNQCRDNGSAGIFVALGASANLAGNTCERNKVNGVCINGKDSSAEIRDNTARENVGAGILFFNGAAGVAEGNTCANNTINGIAAYESDSKPTIRNNQCNDNGGCAILFTNGAGGLAEGNTCNNSKYSGIGVSGQGASPTLRGNDVHGSVMHGITVLDGARPIIEGNNVTKSELSGINVDAANTSPTVRRNKVDDNKQFGITIHTQAGGLFEENTCSGNGYSGIGVHDNGTAPTVRKNICVDNLQLGIRIGQGADGLIEANTCERNKFHGIGVYDEGTRPHLKANRCLNNEQWGIHVASSGKPRIDGDNVVNGNKVGQIQK